MAAAAPGGGGSPPPLGGGTKTVPLWEGPNGRRPDQPVKVVEVHHNHQMVGVEELAHHSW